MASLMFRAKADNRFHAATGKPAGAGTWYVFYYDLRGKKVRLRVGPNKRTAEIAKGDVEARLAKQRAGLLDPDQEMRRTEIVTFAGKLADYLVTENKAPKTIARYQGAFRALREFLDKNEPGLKYLDQLDGPVIERYKDYRRTRPISPNGHPNTPTRPGVSVRTINNELAYMKTILNLAKRRGFIRRNPMMDVNQVDGEKRKQYRPLTKDQTQRLLQAAAPGLRPILLTFLLTGMRTGELLNLEWADIDFERDEIHIRAKKDWRPKDKEARVVPLHHQLKEELTGLKQVSDSGYVFGKGNEPHSNKLLRPLQSTCKRAGIPAITVHNLRDEFASHLVMNGVGIETVSHLLGHSDIQMTWRHYIHLAPQRLKDAVEVLDWMKPAQASK